MKACWVKSLISLQSTILCISTWCLVAWAPALLAEDTWQAKVNPQHSNQTQNSLIPQVHVDKVFHEMSQHGPSQNSVTADLEEEPEATSKEVKTYKVGMSYLNQYPIFSVNRESDKGYAWAILEAFARANNIRFEYISMPTMRLQPSMDNGAIDFIFPDNPNWTALRSNRHPNIFSGPLVQTISASFVALEHENTSIDDIRKVAIPFGYATPLWTATLKENEIKSIPVRDLMTGLNILRTGSVDAADIEFNIGMYLVEKDPMLSQTITINRNLPHVAFAYHLSSIKHILVLEKLTSFVKNEQELIEQLRQQYQIKYHREVFSKTAE